MRCFQHGLKIFPAGRPKFPDIDIFLIDENYQYAEEETRLRWPGDPLPYGALERVVIVPFGHLMLYSLSDIDARKLLDDTYGKNWLTTVDKTHDHLYKRFYHYKSLLLVDNSCARHSAHP